MSTKLQKNLDLQQKIIGIQFYESSFGILDFCQIYRLTYNHISPKNCIFAFVDANMLFPVALILSFLWEDYKETLQQSRNRLLKENVF